MYYRHVDKRKAVINNMKQVLVKVIERLIINLHYIQKKLTDDNIPLHFAMAQEDINIISILNELQESALITKVTKNIQQNLEDSESGAKSASTPSQISVVKDGIKATIKSATKLVNTLNQE